MRSPLPNDDASRQPVTIRLRTGGDASTFELQLVPDFSTGDFIEQVFLALTNVNNVAQAKRLTNPSLRGLRRQ